MSPEKLVQLIGSGLCAAVVCAAGFWYTRPKRVPRAVVRMGARVLMVAVVVGPIFAAGFEPLPEEKKAEEAKQVAAKVESAARDVLKTSCVDACASPKQWTIAQCQKFCDCQVQRLTEGRTATQATAWIDAHTNPDGSQDDELSKAGRVAGERCLKETGLEPNGP